MGCLSAIFRASVNTCYQTNIIEDLFCKSQFFELLLSLCRTEIITQTLPAVWLWMKFFN